MTIKGDINGDGRITYEDLVLIQAYLLGIEELMDVPIEAGDINSDGKIGINDLTAINRHLLGARIINEVIY